MKDAVLMELAKRWDTEAENPVCEDGSESARIGNAVAKGRREAKAECAERLRLLINMLGDPPEPCFCRTTMPATREGG